MGTPRYMPYGEIEFADGTRMLIPQPDPDGWKLVPPGDPENLLEDFYHNEVIAVQKPARTQSKPTGDPPWAVGCVLVGSFVSVASGVFLATLGVLQWVS